MTPLKTTLLSGVAALALVAGPAAAQSANADSSATLGDGEISAEATAETPTLKEEAGEAVDATGDALRATGEAIGDAASATGEAIGDAASATAEAVTDTAEEAGDELAEETGVAPEDTTAGSMIGQTVAASSGESIGEIDDIVRIDNEVMAVIGVGGFLGIGEHAVALPITELDWQGETVTAFGYSEEQLKSMAEYDRDLAKSLPPEEPVTLGKS